MYLKTFSTKNYVLHQIHGADQFFRFLTFVIFFSMTLSSCTFVTFCSIFFVTMFIHFCCGDLVLSSQIPAHNPSIFSIWIPFLSATSFLVSVYRTFLGLPKTFCYYVSLRFLSLCVSPLCCDILIYQAPFSLFLFSCWPAGFSFPFGFFFSFCFNPFLFSIIRLVA